MDKTSKLKERLRTFTNSSNNSTENKLSIPPKSLSLPTVDLESRRKRGTIDSDSTIDSDILGFDEDSHFFIMTDERQALSFLGDTDTEITLSLFDKAQGATTAILESVYKDLVQKKLFRAFCVTAPVLAYNLLRKKEIDYDRYLSRYQDVQAFRIEGERDQKDSWNLKMIRMSASFIVTASVQNGIYPSSSARIIDIFKSVNGQALCSNYASSKEKTREIIEETRKTVGDVGVGQSTAAIFIKQQYPLFLMMEKEEISKTLASVRA
jgi:hypothetical protein